MGTYYAITYLDDQNRNFQKKIDQLLEEINMDVSTYIPESFISRLNTSEKEMTLVESENPHFTKVLKKILYLPTFHHWSTVYLFRKETIFNHLENQKNKNYVPKKNDPIVIADLTICLW